MVVDFDNGSYSVNISFISYRQTHMTITSTAFIVTLVLNTDSFPVGYAILVFSVTK